jgi:hypothetical protein
MIMVDIHALIERSSSAEGEELWAAIRMNHPRIIANAMGNRHLTEGMAVYIGRSRNTPAEVLGALAEDVRFKESYKLKLSLVRNPLMPVRMALRLLKFIRIFDLADISRDRTVSAIVRQKVEEMLIERVAGLPLGVKVALGRRASSRVLEHIMNRGDRRVVDTCLASPRLTEEQLCHMVLRQSTKPVVIKALAEHPSWSLRYSIRLQLVRNFHTPMERVVEMISTLKGNDLRTLYEDTKVPASTKPFIHRELVERGEGLEQPPDVTYELAGDEDSLEEYGWERELAQGGEDGEDQGENRPGEETH